ncbi:MAG: hypothetical protein M3332_14225 [Actinomycetota bacterium]|nr:hypothetical protein [Actinomycetota bacterium]
MQAPFVVACSRDVSRRADQLIGEVFVDPAGAGVGLPRQEPPSSTIHVRR